MFKKILILFHLLIFSLCYSQNKQINFIIVVDDGLLQIYSDEIRLIDDQNNETKVKVSYLPGELTVSQKDYDKISSESTKKLILKVRYIENQGDTKYFDYEISDFNKNWLMNESYFILSIYNTDKKKYRKIYNPLPGKNFTYEYDSPNGSMRRVRKK
ncbi:MAG TPA: hypothetical protein VF677_13155 [Flavobacterium sp.]|jgi:hypothetical protein